MPNNPVIKAALEADAMGDTGTMAAVESNSRKHRYLHTSCAVAKQHEFAPGHFVVHLRCPVYDGAFRAGQFINIKCDDAPYGKLYRPFSVLRYRESEKIMEIYYHVVGEGTLWLAGRAPGSELKVLLPLGNSFSVPEHTESVALVAGGVGIAPLVFLYEQLKRDKHKTNVHFLMGARTRDALCLPLLEEAGIDALFATDDGSFGKKGLVTGILSELLDAQNLDYVAACGPNAMMAAVQKTVAGKCSGEVSLEERMACGIGACFGCVATLRGEGDSLYRPTVCRKGPVFPIEKVLFA